MIIRKATLQAVLPAADSRDVTSRCDKIEVRPDGTVTATNGHVLLSATERTRFLDADFPVKGLPKYHGDPPTAITLNAAEIARVVKALTKKSTMLYPILTAVQLGTDAEGTYLAATDLTSQTVLRVPTQEDQRGQFPAWDRLVPAREEPAICVELSTAVLKVLIQAAETVHGLDILRTQRRATVRLYVRTDAAHQTETGHGNAGIRVEIDGTDTAIVGVVMPCRR